MHQMTLIVASLLLSASGAYDCDIQETSQSLPLNCKQELKKVGECPARDLPADKEFWNRLSYTCCHEYLSTTLHCQQNSNNNGVTIFPACLPITLVPKGHFGMLIKNVSGHSVFKLYSCGSGHYEPEDRPSHHPTVSVCRYSKSCKGKGQRRLCLRGPTQDDFCMCVDGYRPHPDNERCRQGDFQDGECWCVLSPCPQGQVRNTPSSPNVSCDDVAWKVDYSCSARTDGPGTGNFRDGGQGQIIPHNGASSPPTPNPTEGVSLPSSKDSSDENLALRITVGVIVSAVGVAAVAACWLCRKKIRGYVHNIRRKVCERRWRQDAGTATAAATAEAGISDDETEMTSLNSSSGTT